MAPKPSKIFAEIGFVRLRNCLVNLPANLSEVLVNSNTAAQNVVIELGYSSPTETRPSAKQEQFQKSIYVGWTGLDSQRKTSRPAVTSRASRYGTNNESLGVVEIDSTFGRLLGLSESLRVAVILHADPPIAQAVSIEPLTVSDWEIIELHATFLETNLQAQIRALPNPLYDQHSSSRVTETHPLTIHLSPTSTANVSITSVSPAPPSQAAFLKLSPDAEVIIAPKVRPRLSRAGRTDTGSITSTSHRSATGRSGVGSARQKSSKALAKKSLFLRGSDQSILNEDPTFESKREAIELSVDAKVLEKDLLKDAGYVCVSVVSSNTVYGTNEFHQRLNRSNEETQRAQQSSVKLVAKLSLWHDAPGSRDALLSPLLAKSLGCEYVVGIVLRVEPASSPLTKSTVVAFKVWPFLPGRPGSAENLRLSNRAKVSQDSAISTVGSTGHSIAEKLTLAGPLTDGMTIFGSIHGIRNWHGGLIKFEYANQARENKQSLAWLQVEEISLDVRLLQAIPNPSSQTDDSTNQLKPISLRAPLLVGSETTVEKIVQSLLHSSTVLVTGSVGSGKSATSLVVAHHLRKFHLFQVSCFDCRKLLGDEARPTLIKETLNKLSMTAVYGTRLGGKSLVVLDDLEKLCAAETELQVGNENGRNRQTSELVRSTIREMRNSASNISVLITAHSKDSLHQVITGGHVIQETVALKPPDKNVRLGILKLGVRQTGFDVRRRGESNQDWVSADNSDSMSDDSNNVIRQRPTSLSSGTLESKIDFLELGRQTEGFMPGDLHLLISRAESEALARHISQSRDNSPIELVTEDFSKAIEGFTPTSLKNVVLQASSVKFDKIGGLGAAKKTLIETLQYPTMYAPIFDQCPLRLRSGLLLYGHPGCGKTMLASAVAGECGLNFISVKGPEILNKYIGASEKSIRDLFERAEAAKPCVLFFDEFDSIAPKRGHDSTGVTDRVVNQLLTQMDGAEGLSGVYVLAATSRPDLIDPALLRPGRLDKAVLCGMPSVEDRMDILRVVSKNLKVDSSIFMENRFEGTLGEVAQRTVGYTNADLQAILYNAHLRAVNELLENSSEHQIRRKSHVEMNRGRRRSLPYADVIYFPFAQKKDESFTDERQHYFSSHTPHKVKLAALEVKLREAKMARRREREQRRCPSDAKAIPGEASSAKRVEVIIVWKHIDFSLKSTRSSMSAQEKAKLDAIYEEFETARSGEMPSGQASSEIGARSSLM